MKLGLEFLGAAGQVTGSKTLLTFHGKKYLVDCGLFQGPKEQKLRNWENFPVDLSQIEKIILTHAHLDHSGYLPRLVKQGYKGEIWCTEGTEDLLEVLLLDAARLQMEDAKYANATGHSKHKPALALYTEKDVYETLKLVRAFPRDEWVPLDKDISLRFQRAGHIIGASFIQFSLSMESQIRTLTFSGDLGHDKSFTLKAPVDLMDTDYLVLESTYGNRLHDAGNPLTHLCKTIRKVIEQKGVLIIPAFAVGRSQEILYMIRLLEDAERIPKIPVLLDSPMAIKATEVFLLHHEDHRFNSEFVVEGNSLFPALFETIEGADESMMSCMRPGPMIVIAGAGMLNGGRVLHHLKKRLPDAKNIVLFSGFQAESTKGRYLQDEAKKSGLLRIHHQEYEVEASIETLPSLSAHGDAHELMAWCSHLRRKPKKVFLNHGQQEAMLELAKSLREELDWDVEPVLVEKAYKLL
jgi:metallo-beta-lactamase family protein